MKKFTLAAVMLLGYFSSVSAAGINIGISGSLGAYEVDGASESFTGSHSSSNAASTAVKKSNIDEADSAEGEFGLGHIFIEKTLGDSFAIGLDYVPGTQSSDTTENVQSSTTGKGDSTNTVQVDFKHLTTLYATYTTDLGVYAKLGTVQVDAESNEKLATGGSYGNASLEGWTVGLGFNKDLGPMFVRIEASHLELDGVTLTNVNDSDKSVSVDGLTGYSGKISIGRSF